MDDGDLHHTSTEPNISHSLIKKDMSVSFNKSISAMNATKFVKDIPQLKEFLASLQASILTFLYDKVAETDVAERKQLA